jgi:cyclophilin family peptidyl-prolyl cis-trans isomerase
MIAHVESGLYDGVFFHRVIDDFVTQSGDPTCKALGAYPLTSPNCGSGGTGETIPLEHDENLSHVDGALGMARSADPDSADAQWYIAETEAHNLDPENRDDEGYATFGIVRDGMTHIRAIAATPTSDEPSGIDEIQNPASSAGRPIYQVEILSMEMIGVADPDGLIRNPPEPVETQSLSWNPLSVSPPFRWSSSSSSLQWQGLSVLVRRFLCSWNKKMASSWLSW